MYLCGAMLSQSLQSPEIEGLVWEDVPRLLLEFSMFTSREERGADQKILEKYFSLFPEKKNICKKNIF